MKTIPFEIRRTNEFNHYERCVADFGLNGHSLDALEDFKQNSQVHCYLLRHSTESPKPAFARVVVDKDKNAFFDDMTLDSYFLLSVLESFKEKEIFNHMYLPCSFKKYVPLSSCEDIAVPVSSKDPIHYLKHFHKRNNMVLKYF